MARIILSLVFIFFLTSLTQASGGYNCKINEAKQVSDKGVFEEYILADEFIGKSFVVDIETRRLTGILVNHNGEYGQPTVLDYGTLGHQNYKVITIYKPYENGSRHQL